MRDPVFALTVLSAMAVTLGLFVLVTALIPRPARLADALGLLGGGDEAVHDPVREVEAGDWATRLGARVASQLRLGFSDRTRRTLALQGRTIGDFVTQKMLLAAVGLVTPVLLVSVLQGFGHALAPVPLGLSLAAGLFGWFHPDLELRRVRQAVSADAAEALFTFFDLVTLERLANRSSSQALASAAQMSENPLFLRLRSTLELARLEQRPPWQHLRRLADELEMPEIGDIADVMRLDEQGAALAGALRARVAELRDAQLLRERTAAHQVSERMTLWMTVPTMIFGLLFLAPPLLKIAGLG